MSNVPVLFQMLVDSSQMDEVMTRQRAEQDAIVAEWRSKRQQILLEMHSINLGIGLIIQTIRTVAMATGETLDPIANALLGMISSTTSIIIATATAMAAGSLGLLTGAALALAAFAFGFSLAQTAKTLADFEKFKGDFASINRRLARIEGAGVPAGRPF